MSDKLLATAPETPPNTVKKASFFVEQQDKLLRQLGNVGVSEKSSIVNMKNVTLETDEKDRVADFRYFYDKYRDTILGSTDSAWLKKGVEWVYDPTNTAPNIRIVVDVGSIYENAVEISEKKKVGMKPGDKKVQDVVILPDTILLHLYRIFATLEDKEKDKIEKRVSEVESRLGIKKQSAPSLPQSFELPAGVWGFMAEAPKLVGSIMSDPKAQNMLSKINDKLSNAQNVGVAVQRILEMTQDAGFTELLTEKVTAVLPPGMEIPPSVMASATGTSTLTDSKVTEPPKEPEHKKED
jgi:hypothetical protein